MSLFGEADSRIVQLFKVLRQKWINARYIRNLAMIIDPMWRFESYDAVRFTENSKM